MTFNDTLNGKNLFTQFHCIIQTGTAGLLEFPERKEPKSQDWSDENDTEYDLEVPKFKGKEVTLNCAIVADNDAQYWTYYNALWNELKKSGRQSLYIYDHGMTYQVWYKKSGSFKKTLKRLKNVQKVFVKFTLTFQVQY